jgi:gluconolactonase
VGSSLTNLAFGGPDRTTLFVTAGKTLYSMQMNLPGFPN